MRKIRTMFFIAMAAVATVGCNHMLQGKPLAEYCSNPHNQDTDLCSVNTEIASTNAKLAVTDKTANDALSLATTANGKNVVCQTVTLRHAKSASCAAGYTLMGCTQTHYTKRAGAMSIIRSVNDQQCTFAAKVLEVQARCCMVGTPTQTAEAPPLPAAPATPKPTS
jgi:hypothetical protein